MVYKFNLNNRAIDAIINRTKRVEIRTNNNFDYSKIQVGDIIIFTSPNKKSIKCKILKNLWYISIEELLKKEGTTYTLSSTNDYDEGIKSIYSIDGYERVIKTSGVYALHLEYICTI
ncbi:MAG: hypothetical protein IJI43_01115 [Bacilli bacterium]|nr:hypothetical protein [Bacilli bacterium]